jgi:shikimate kinase
MMGAGKTTVGKKLSRALGWQFVDLDQNIEAMTGVSVATIFEIEGEMGFRQRESQALTLLASASRPANLVVATGGGVVLSPMNRVRMISSGLVAYLHASPDLLYSRTKHDRGRPLLQVADPFGRIKMLVEKRDPLYREVADFVVESNIGLNNTVSCIAKEIESRCRA